MSAEGLANGTYRTPVIGELDSYSAAETILHVSDDDIIAVESPLYQDPYRIGDGSSFKDPRVESFLFHSVQHQIHHLDIRQLSLPEHIETRPGAGRYSRLGGVLDSAKILADMGATYEQIAQTLISDFAHPVGSHLRGDFLGGDYAQQETHDSDLWDFLKGSGYVSYLIKNGVLDEQNYLSGSYTTLFNLADPRNPRRYDITECPRPDPNADRIEFTLHEGVLIHDPKEVQKVLDHVMRIETADGERMAFTDVDAARLVFTLAVRHQSEHWAEPMHRFQEELLLFIDRHAAVDSSPIFAEYQQYRPTDYAYTAEHLYYERLDYFAGLDPLIACTLGLAKQMSNHQRQLDFHGYDDHAYDGPVLPNGVVIDEHEYKTNLISVSGDEIWVRLKAPKYRGPIDGMVVTKNGLKRVSEMVPELLDYESSRKRWLGSLLIRMTLPKPVIQEFARSVVAIKKTWGAPEANRQTHSPLYRPRMPYDELEINIDIARSSVKQKALL